MIKIIVNDKRKMAYLMTVGINFLLTFVLERFILVFDNGYEEMISIPLSTSGVSTSTEFIITYILSKFMCFLILAIFWYIFFYLVQKIDKKVLFPIMVVLIIGAFVCLITYPDNNMDDLDNYTNYLYAIRLIPTYWQHVITGAFYAGCCMVLPHPVAIPLIQWCLLVCVLGYIMQKIETNFGGALYLVPLILLLFPDTFYIAYNPYRNDLYTVLTLFYFAFLYFEI